VNKLVCLGDADFTSDLIDLAVRRNYKEICKTIFKGEDILRIHNRSIYFNMKEANDYLNVINSTAFLVTDLNIFVEKLKYKGYVVNTGPQA
jgi:hypothetical protein